MPQAKLTKPKNVRVEHDAYYTPPWPIHRLFHALSHELATLAATGGDLCDPCAGGGAILAVANAHGVPWHQLVAGDVDPRALRQLEALQEPLQLVRGDALMMGAHGCRWVVTNPPYIGTFPLRLARVLLEEMAEPGGPELVAMLLRLSILETPTRAAFLQAHPPHVYVIPERVSYTGDGGSDNVGAAWFVWRRGETQGRLSWLTDESVQPRLQLELVPPCAGEGE